MRGTAPFLGRGDRLMPRIMGRIALSLFAAACLSTACERADENQAHKPGPPPPAAQPVASPPLPIENWRIALPLPAAVPRNGAAGPAGRDDKTWLLNAVERSNFPSLSYMSLDGREIVFDLWCRWRGSVILARMTDRRLERAMLRLRSGPPRLSAALGRSREFEGGFAVGAVLDDRDPVLRNFGLTGRLGMRLRGRTVALDAVDDRERAAVRRFLELCFFPSSTGPALPWRHGAASHP